MYGFRSPKLTLRSSREVPDIRRFFANKPVGDKAAKSLRLDPTGGGCPLGWRESYERRTSDRIGKSDLVDKSSQSDWFGPREGRGRTMYTGDYRAVSIQHSGDCCRSARALNGKRFLSTNAPELPLVNCATPGLCQCQYRTLTERRDDHRPAPREPARAAFKALAVKLFSSKRTTDTV